MKKSTHATTRSTSVDGQSAMEETFRQVYWRRQELGLRDQELHKEDLEHLGSLLEQANVPHPYCAKAVSILRGENTFSNSDIRRPRGPSIRIYDTCADRHLKYLYRIHPLDGINWLPFLKDTLVTPKKIMGRLQSDSRSRPSDSGWLPLADYASGVVQNRRSFSWWTSLEPSQTSIVDWTLELGLLRDNLRPTMILLRLPLNRVDELELAHVPSSLDAFDSPVFRPVRYDSPLRCGASISLRQLPQFGLGAEEITLAPIPVEELHFMPMRSFMSQHKVDLTEILLILLLKYYEGI